MAFKDYFKKNRAVTVSGTPGFQRIYGKGQAGPVYSVDEIVKAILDGKITATELATDFEWTGSDTDRAKALLAVGNEVANERFKDSVKIEHKTDFGTVSKETAQVIQQFQQWAAQNGLENCPGITGAKITVGSESYEFDYPTQPQVQNPGAPVLPTATPAGSPTPAAGTAARCLHNGVLYPTTIVKDKDDGKKSACLVLIKKDSVDKADILQPVTRETASQILALNSGYELANWSVKSKSTSRKPNLYELGDLEADF